MIFLETETLLSTEFVRIVGLLTITARLRWKVTLKIVQASDGSVKRRELQKENIKGNKNNKKEEEEEEKKLNCIKGSGF